MEDKLEFVTREFIDSVWIDIPKDTFFLAKDIFRPKVTVIRLLDTGDYIRLIITDWEGNLLTDVTARNREDDLNHIFYFHTIR